MNLYEINSQIEFILSQVNDDGELPDDALYQLEQLAMDERTKLENIACYIKDLLAEVKALRAEEIALAERRKSKENKAERLKDYLSRYMTSKDYGKYETPRAVMSFRTSQGVVVDDESIVPGNYFKVERKVSIATIKDDLKAGIAVPGVHVEERKNIQIK